MAKPIIIPETFAGCKTYCSQCGIIYSAEVHAWCPECGKVDWPVIPEIPDDDFDPAADPILNDEDFKREFKLG